MGECANECCIERLNEKEVLPHMRWQTCMLPRELIWEGVAPPQEKVESHSMESSLSRKNCEETFENLQKHKILSVLYKCNKCILNVKCNVL